MSYLQIIWVFSQLTTCVLRIVTWETSQKEMLEEQKGYTVKGMQIGMCQMIGGVCCDFPVCPVFIQPVFVQSISANPIRLG